MNLSMTAAALWALGFALDVALFVVLLNRQRYKVVPWFTTWIAFGVLYTVFLFSAYRLGMRRSYADVYWSGAFLDFLFQIAVVLEIARSVLRRSGRWVEGARARLVLAGAGSSLVALGLAWGVTPAAETRLDAWEARASLFTTLLICLLFTSIMAASQRLGLSWRSHVMREGYGLTIWVLVAFFTDTLHAYWRTAEHFTALEHVRMAFYLGSLVYWIVAFWIPEKLPSSRRFDIKNKMKGLDLPLDYVSPTGSSPTDGASSK